MPSISQSRTKTLLLETEIRYLKKGEDYVRIKILETCSQGGLDQKRYLLNSGFQVSKKIRKNSDMEPGDEMSNRKQKYKLSKEWNAEECNSGLLRDVDGRSLYGFIKKAPAKKRGVVDSVSKLQKVNKDIGDVVEEQQQLDVDIDDEVTDEESGFGLEQEQGGNKNNKNRQSVSKQDEVDLYFMNRTANSKSTSNETMASLPILTRQSLSQKLQELKPQCEAQVNQLIENASEHYQKWVPEMIAGNFNILLFGYGSKKQVCSNFTQRYLQGHHVIEVNGYFPNLTIQKILSFIGQNMLDCTSSMGNILDQLKFIETMYNEHFSNDSSKHLFLVIHNIDGVSLRSKQSQSILALLSNIVGIHVVATIDHVNALNLWDSSIKQQFRWLCYDVTTFAMYRHETEYENGILVQSNDTNVRAVLTVLRSLTPNGQKIFEILLDYQIKNMQNPSYLGMNNRLFYQECFKDFIVSNEVAFKSQLTEFKDHNVIKTKLSAGDGQEYVHIPLAIDMLEAIKLDIRQV